MKKPFVQNLTCLLWVASFFLLAGYSHAATIFVDASNSTAIEDGTSTYPFNTVQEGLDQAAAYDTVLVAPGIYYGPIELRDDVELASAEGPNMTIIDGMGQANAVRAPYVTSPVLRISGFTIRNAVTLIYAWNRVYMFNLSQWYIKDCIFRDATSSGINIGPHATTYIFKTIFFKTGRSAITGIWNYFPLLTNVTIDNVDVAINDYEPYYSVSLENTTISNVQQVFAIPVRANYGGGNRIVNGRNNNFWNYGSFSWTRQGYIEPSYELTNTTSVEPLFVDPLQDDYHLQPGSPLIDAGIIPGRYPDIYYSGIAPDVGAIEFDSLTTEELMDQLAESYQEIPLEGFKNAAEQRLNSFANKFRALLHKLDSISDEMSAEEKIVIYQECLDKLRNDIWAKADGYHGGNPKNDWITTKADQDELYPRVMGLIEAIEADITALGTL